MPYDIIPLHSILDNSIIDNKNNLSFMVLGQHLILTNIGKKKN